MIRHDSATTLEMPPPREIHGPSAPVHGSSFGPREFFEEFFRRLEARGIPYVILHGYDDFPARFGSDVKREGISQPGRATADRFRGSAGCGTEIAVEGTKL